MMLSNLEAARIKNERPETYWKPFHNGTLMCVTLSGSGKRNGLYGIEHQDRFHYLAHVLRTKGCEVVKPGDTVLFEEGAAEPMADATGETFFILNEHAILNRFPGMVS
jgi:hypothetical protein